MKTLYFIDVNSNLLKNTVFLPLSRKQAVYSIVILVLCMIVLRNLRNSGAL